MRSFIAYLLPALAVASPLGIVQPSPDGWADGPDPKQIQITSATFSGNGCPQGTVSTSISPDKTVRWNNGTGAGWNITGWLTSLSWKTTRFQVYIGQGYNPTEKTKNCQLHLNLKYPGGFQFSVLESTYHGYAMLEPGVTGTFFSTYYFSQAPSDTTTTQTTISGGGIWSQGQVYTKTDKVPTASYIYSPCGSNGILNVNNRIALTSSNSSAVGEITDDDATVAFTQQINLAWKPCGK